MLFARRFYIYFFDLHAESAHKLKGVIICSARCAEAGIVIPIISAALLPSLFIASAATSRASVESSPPEMPTIAPAEPTCEILLPARRTEWQNLAASFAALFHHPQAQTDEGQQSGVLQIVFIILHGRAYDLHSADFV